MAERTGDTVRDSDVEPAPISAREALRLAREYAGEITGSDTAQLTSAVPAAEGGWMIEAEVVEEHRIPSSSDVLALYEIELDADGNLLAYRRTHRYTRSQMVTGGGGPA